MKVQIIHDKGGTPTAKIDGTTIPLSSYSIRSYGTSAEVEITFPADDLTLTEGDGILHQVTAELKRDGTHDISAFSDYVREEVLPHVPEGEQTKLLLQMITLLGSFSRTKFDNDIAAWEAKR